MPLGLLCLAIALLGAMLSVSHTDGWLLPKPKAAEAPNYQTLELGTTPYRFPIYANRNLTSDDMRSIEHVLVLQHGIKRDGDSYYELGQNLLDANPARTNDTLLLAPKFVGRSDLPGYDGMVVWRDDDWPEGLESVQPVPVSSFQVYDDILRSLSNRTRFPLLRTLTLAGHSAGGQMMQRYALLNDIDESIRAANFTLRYVIANPSSYLYLTDERPTSADGFAPYNRTLCRAYNRYKYGLERLIAYPRETNASRLFTRHADRDVTNMLGGADNNPNHTVLDKSCQGEAQGPHRLARGLAYLRYEVLQACAKPLSLRRVRYEVVDVGHSAPSMFGSVCGAVVLLGEGARPLRKGALCNPIPAAACSQTLTAHRGSPL